MALPKLDNALQTIPANDNQRSKVLEGFSSTSNIVANALATEVAPDAADDRIGLKLVSESISKLHDTVYKTLALLKSRTMLEDYIADDQLRVQAENLKEGDTARLLNQEAGLGGSLMGSGDEQSMLVAALGSMSEALEQIIETVNNLELGGGGSGGGGDMPPVDIDLGRRRPRPATPRRDTRFVPKSTAVDRKGKVRPGYTAVSTGKSGTRYMRSATAMGKSSILGRLTARGGKVTSTTGMLGGAALAGLSALGGMGGFGGRAGGGSFGAGGIMGGALGGAMGGFGFAGMAAGAMAAGGMGVISMMSAPRPQPMQPQTGPFTVGLGGFAIPTAGTITSNFGPRTPFKTSTGISSSDHKGVDIAAPHGAPVIASKDGIVTFAGPRGGYGNLIIIDHGGGVETRYAHLSAIGVSTNTSVRQGQIIGNVGSTGSSTGSHLHFEIRSGGQTIDPATYIGASPPSRDKVAALTPPPRAPVSVQIPGPAAPAPAQLAALSAPGSAGSPSPYNPQREYVDHWGMA